MAVAWPGTITQNMLAGSYSEKPDRNVASFAPEVGPSIDRRRTSIASSQISFQSRYSSAEKALFDAFYRDDLADGTLVLTRKNPKSGATITCKFSEAPSFSDLSPGYYLASLAFSVLP